ncbi:hypothetical protein SAY87_024165 [Trapa incisa]|uniref:Ribosomal protein L34e superfamily protein n=1 Tax=Trapa incisa TaxID=236973 RepID=A0AAN7L2G3_9MYRT|nr:hypothetical protein SAY87_024165 [Trapa incisa]
MLISLAEIPLTFTHRQSLIFSPEMVDHYLPGSISDLKLADQLAVMASTLSSLDPLPKSRGISHAHRNRKLPNFPACPHITRSAVVDIVILIAVIGAFGFLLYPYIKFIVVKSITVIGAISFAVKDELCDAPLIYASIGVSVFFAASATCALVVCTSRNKKCENPNCRGLSRAAEFDIQLDTEECVKNSSAGSNMYLFELPINHHRELKAGLRKMAPPNGRAVLVYRARCGCSVGRLEVPGPRKLRKIKK